jgi:hypothetical protein
MNLQVTNPQIYLFPNSSGVTIPALQTVVTPRPTIDPLVIVSMSRTGK